MASSNSVAFLSSVGAGRQSASYFDRTDTISAQASTTTMGGFYGESCPAGVKCPFRSKHQVEVGRNNSLTASNAVLEESNNYLQRKCDALVIQNERLRQELNASERSAVDAHRKASASAGGSASGLVPDHVVDPMASSAHSATNNGVIPPPAWQQQFQELKDDIQQSREDRNVLLSQVRMLQDALDKMTAMNEDLLRHVRRSGEPRYVYNPTTAVPHHENAMAVIDAHPPAGYPATNDAFAVTEHNHYGASFNAAPGASSDVSPTQQRAGSTGASGGAWGAAMMMTNPTAAAKAIPNTNSSVSRPLPPSAAAPPTTANAYLFGGHKGYPAEEELKDPAASPIRYGPRDAAKVEDVASKMDEASMTTSATTAGVRRLGAPDRYTNSTAPRGLTSDMSGISTQELLEQQQQQSLDISSAPAQPLGAQQPPAADMRHHDFRSPSHTCMASNIGGGSRPTHQDAMRGVSNQPQQDGYSPAPAHPSAASNNALSSYAALGNPPLPPTSAVRDRTPDRRRDVAPASFTSAADGGATPTNGANKPPSTPHMPAFLIPTPENVALSPRAPPTRARAGSENPNNTSHTFTQHSNETSKVLDGILPPQQAQHYRVRDGGVGTDGRSRSVGMNSMVGGLESDDGLNNDSLYHPTSTGRSNSTRRPTRTAGKPANPHPSGAPEEGRDNIYSRLHQQGPTGEQGAPFKSGPAGRPTTPVRDGGANNPLQGATPARMTHGGRDALPPLPTKPTAEELAALAAAKAREEEESRLARERAAAELELIERNRREREQQRLQQLKELEDLEREQAELLRRESSMTRPKPDLIEEDVDEEVKRPRRGDSALLGSATRLVKRERVVFLRIPGKELYLEMLLKDGAGITRRTVANHPQKGLASVWECFFKK